jgi:hypothetical protein
MRIIISDSSCLIDLRKASLLAVFLRLPFEILIPNTLFEGELLSFTDDEKKTLLEKSFVLNRDYRSTTGLRSLWQRSIKGASC